MMNGYKAGYEDKPHCFNDLILFVFFFAIRAKDTLYVHWYAFFKCCKKIFELILHFQAEIYFQLKCMVIIWRFPFYYCKYRNANRHAFIKDRRMYEYNSKNQRIVEIQG